MLIPMANDATDKADTGNDVVLLLSDRCPYTSQIALFSSGFPYTSIRREEFPGPIGAQYQNIVDFIMRLNAIQSRFVGMDRIDQYDYPPAALRKALALVFVYRNYQRLTPLRIKIFPNRIECVCPGHFPTQYVRKKQEFSEGARIIPPLAAFFTLQGVLPDLKQGALCLHRFYDEAAQKPSVENSDNFFRLTLPQWQSELSAKGLY